ncbi:MULTISPECIES: hypothetical protein [Pseudomonas syringae group]|uniref:Uncharacterized protein n=1 Tax=Pseudomonas syringae group genomosp. 3 TaxID=251701 RepID=A0A2K4W9V1_9PSED|nr:MULTISPECIES: hypothetical protein [Pseudomonas syringae group]SOS32658.1 hypothetical protein CFBP6411_01298 [Pseudomonas syringae group genomosp. 3]SPF11639.1 hypothetical protein PSCFBP3800_01594 [Pseudomonas syringae group genomosp. 3]
MKPVIRQGDTLQEYGGEVLEGHYECHGKPLACQGDATGRLGRGFH